MEKNEIKKSLYKQNPIAEFSHIYNGKAYYDTWLENLYSIRFEIPVDDMGNATFESKMRAKLLIRWII